MRLLKNDTSFFWDDMVHHMFNNLKHALTHAPMLQPLDYIKDYSLYVVASLSTIGMVLVHTDENDQEHVIYYVKKSLLDSEIFYSHVKKLAMATVIVVQKSCHYILLHTNIVYVDSNTMYYKVDSLSTWGKIIILYCHSPGFHVGIFQN